MRDGVERRTGFRATIAASLLLILGLVVVVVANPADSSNSSAPYEPNDTRSTAAGPLKLNQPYVAAIEGEDDRDYFALIVPRETPLSVTLRNLGGGRGEDPTVEVTIEGADQAAIETLSVRERAYETESATFSHGEYVVVVTSRMGHGEAYSLSINGVDGALKGGIRSKRVHLR